MSHDTQAVNKQRLDLSIMDEIWLFGYGSLIHKIDFPILEQQDALVNGWTRRFWQGSHDHRGTPANPGRVLTLIKAEQEQCQGVAFRVTHEVFDYLDHREKNGYLRHPIDIELADNRTVSGVIYIADDKNAAYLGPASEKDIAKHIANSAGPSGRNSDYLYHLADALREKAYQDQHIFAIEQELNRLITR